jgi:hypothetical protein
VKRKHFLYLPLPWNEDKKIARHKCRAIKPNGAKLYVAVFGGRELKTLFLRPKCKTKLYLFGAYFMHFFYRVPIVGNKKAASLTPAAGILRMSIRVAS